MDQTPVSAYSQFNDPYNKIMANAPAVGGGAKNTWDEFTDWIGATHHGRTYDESVAANNRYAERAELASARAWEEWFDSTATQRRVEDIKKAGLNPWLALQSGGISSNGASSVSSAKADTYKTSNKKNAMSDVVNLLGSVAKIVAFAAMV